MQELSVNDLVPYKHYKLVYIRPMMKSIASIGNRDSLKLVGLHDLNRKEMKYDMLLNDIFLLVEKHNFNPVVDRYYTVVNKDTKQTKVLLILTKTSLNYLYTVTGDIFEEVEI